jgi:hypothetical protein
MAKRKNRRRSNEIAVRAPQSQNESLSVRQISNGFIIERSGVKRGRYFSHQEYSAGRPVISAAAPRPAKVVPAPRTKTRPRSEHREVGYLRQTD